MPSASSHSVAESTDGKSPSCGRSMFFPAAAAAATICMARLQRSSSLPDVRDSEARGGLMKRLFLLALMLGQGQPSDHPSVTVHGRTYTPQSILTRNMGTPEDQAAQFPPHKIIGNIYYVGTRTLSSFLVVTPQGNIIIDSTYERNVPTIQKSVQQLGFKFSYTK